MIGERLYSALKKGNAKQVSDCIAEINQNENMSKEERIEALFAISDGEYGLVEAMFNGHTQAVGVYIQAILAATFLSDTDKKKLVEAKKDLFQQPLLNYYLDNTAFKPLLADMLEVYVNSVLGSTLPDQIKAEILESNFENSPVFYQLFLNDTKYAPSAYTNLDAENDKIFMEVYMGAILASPLSEELQEKLVLAKYTGVPAFRVGLCAEIPPATHIMTGNLVDARKALVKGYMAAVLRSKASLGMKKTLLEAKGDDGVTGIQRSWKLYCSGDSHTYGNVEAIYVREILQSNLPIDESLKLLPKSTERLLNGCAQEILEDSSISQLSKLNTIKVLNLIGIAYESGVRKDHHHKQHELLANFLKSVTLSSFRNTDGFKDADDLREALLIIAAACHSNKTKLYKLAQNAFKSVNQEELNDVLKKDSGAIRQKANALLVSLGVTSTPAVQATTATASVSDASSRDASTASSSAAGASIATAMFDVMASKEMASKEITWDSLKRMGKEYKSGIFSSKHPNHKLIAEAMKDGSLETTLRGMVGDNPKLGFILIYMALDNTKTQLAKSIGEAFTNAGMEVAELSKAREHRFEPPEGSSLSVAELIGENWKFYQNKDNDFVMVSGLEDRAASVAVAQEEGSEGTEGASTKIVTDNASTAGTAARAKSNSETHSKDDDDMAALEPGEQQKALAKTNATKTSFFDRLVDAIGRSMDEEKRNAASKAIQARQDEYDKDFF